MAERLLRRVLRDESGMTLIELLVAAVLIAVGIVALFTVFDSSRGLITTSEKNDVAAHQGETEMEQILGLPYASVALTAAPAHSVTTTDPDYYVQPSGSYQWDQSATPKPADPMVVDPAAGALTHLSGWNDGQSRLSGSIYRYVTWVDDPNIPGTQDAKRITLAITVNNNGPGASGALKKPVIVSSIVVDPKAGP